MPVRLPGSALPAMPMHCPQSIQRVPPPHGSSAIELRHLSKTFPGGQAPALDDVDLCVPRGGFFGILGPNGAGKTTLMSVLAGLLKPSSGTVRIDGRNGLAERAAIKRILGIVPQEPAIYPTLTARENLDFFGRMQGLAGDLLHARVLACLGLAEMNAEADQRVERLSGGFKRRLNMVIGLIHEPQILILDEPTVAIDPHSRSLIHQRLRELHQAGITILISTHYMEEAEQLCQEIAIIDQGRVLVQGTVPDLLAGQASQTVQIQLTGDPPPDLGPALGHLPGIARATVGGRCVTAVTRHPEQAIPPLLEMLDARGLKVRSLIYGVASLEQVFLRYTGGRSAPR